MTYSSTLMVRYADLVRQPISSDSFAGDEVRYSSEFEALEAELEKAQSLHASGPIDWLKVQENSEHILRHSSTFFQGFACCCVADVGVASA